MVCVGKLQEIYSCKTQKIYNAILLAKLYIIEQL
ncbi:hypothetical protein NIES4073_52100 [Kalymmatonema gypsitolerans NIES-4073]|nr:hypothetical protein NIES4073_52100 [Scytonema sp. NIES-4073]